MKARKRSVADPNQREFGILWDVGEYPFKLRAGDVVKIDNRLCRVIRVTESCAVVTMNQPMRVFKTRFDKPVKFQPSPKRFYISSNSEVPVLNRKRK